MQFRNVIVSASRGLTPAEWAALGPYYDLRALTNQIDPRIAERFDVQRSAARGYVVDAVHQIAAQNLQRGIIPGSSFRNVHVALVLRGLTTARVGLPAYVLAYRYRGALYRAIVHGQRREVVFGSSPLDVKKIAMLVGVILAVIAVIAAFVILH